MAYYIDQIKPEEMSSESPHYEDLQLELENEDFLKRLRNAKESNETIIGFCELCNPDGTLVVDLGNGFKGTVAREEVTYKTGHDKKVHLGKCMNRVGLNINVKILDIQESATETKILLSRKAAMEEIEKKYAKELKVGDVLKGIVTGIQDYGAFIDIGGDVSGTLSIQDISWTYVKHPSDKLKIGQIVDVAVNSILVSDDNNIKITFTRKELLPGWDRVHEFLTVGETRLGTVKNKIDTGIFIELNDFYEGLADFPSDRTLKYGSQVRVRVIGVYKDSKKIKLKLI